MPLDSVVTLRLDGTAVEGEIHSPITAEMTSSVDRDWPSLLAQHDQPDKDWRWEQILRHHPDGEAYKSFALTCRNRVEGLLVVNRERQMRGELVTGSYMEYVASAPWNRAARGGGALVAGHGRVTPCGQVLVARAAMFSVEEGHRGWLGWNSLPGDTLSWYRKLIPGAKSDFPVIPVDDHYQYVEMKPDDAVALLSTPPAVTRK